MFIFIDNFSEEDFFNSGDNVIYVFKRDYFNPSDDLLWCARGEEIPSQVFDEEDREDVRNELQDLLKWEKDFEIRVKTNKKGETLEECFDKPEYLPILTDEQIIDLVLMRLKLLDPENSWEASRCYIHTIVGLCYEYCKRATRNTELGKVFYALDDLIYIWEDYTSEQYKQAEKIIRRGDENILIELQKVGFDFEVR